MDKSGIAEFEYNKTENKKILEVRWNKKEVSLQDI